MAPTSWITIDADEHEITAAGGILVLFKNGEEVAVVRHWNELVKLDTENS